MKRIVRAWTESEREELFRRFVLRSQNYESIARELNREPHDVRKMGKKLRLHQKAEHLAYLQKAIAVARKTGACVVCMQPWSPLQGWEDLQIDALRALASLQAPEGQ